MPKRITRKLNEKVKERIKREWHSLRVEDFDGAALAYLNQVRGGHAGAKKRKDRTAVIGKFTVPKDSELYRIIERGAELKKMTVAKFIKEYQKELEEVAEHGDFVQQRETEYLIEDVRRVKKGNKVLVNDGNGYSVVPKLRDVLNIQQFTQHIMGNTDIFLIVYRVHYKTTGDLSHYLPSVDEYEGLEEEHDIEAMLDDYYPEITYLKSGKKDAPKKEKVIEEGSKERKKKGGKSRTHDRSKRKIVPKARPKK